MSETRTARADHPAHEKAIAGLYDVLEASAELEADHGQGCGCSLCDDLVGLRRSLQLMLMTLECQAMLTPAREECRDRYEQRLAELKAEADETPVPVLDDCR
jgi:hypothetical protein